MLLTGSMSALRMELFVILEIFSFSFLSASTTIEMPLLNIIDVREVSDKKVLAESQMLYVWRRRGQDNRARP